MSFAALTSHIIMERITSGIVLSAFYDVEAVSAKKTMLMETRCNTSQNTMCMLTPAMRNLRMRVTHPR